MGHASEKYTTPHHGAAQNLKFAGTNLASASGTSIALTVVASTAMPGPPHDGHAGRVFASGGGEQHSIMLKSMQAEVRFRVKGRLKLWPERHDDC